MKFLVLVSTLLLCRSLTVSANQQPNVLFILIDDFGWGDVGYNGSTFYETPRIDGLSKEWMRFDHCYTPSPMCSPTRASILTGKNPARHGITQWLPGRDQAFLRTGEVARVYCPKPQSPALEKSETTLGEVFQEAGYETALYGKWHMGPLKGGGPAAHGYASSRAVIQTNGCSMFYPFRQGRKADDVAYFPEAKEGDHFTNLLTDAAIEFMAREREVPFYLHLCHFAMHAPIACTPKEEAHFEKKRPAGPTTSVIDDYSHQETRLRQDDPIYAGELRNLDTNIGRLVDALKESGQYENTIIVFTGDNGGRSSMNKPSSTSNAPLRTGKTFLFEGGLRTPTLIYWPGHTTPGASTETPITSMDFYPTLLEMAGLPALPEQHLDGVSLVPLFYENPIEREALFWHFPHYQGEGSYPASAIRVGDIKLILNYHHDDVLLYDLDADPYEENDLSAARPEVAAGLKTQLLEYLGETGAYLPRPR